MPVRAMLPVTDYNGYLGLMPCFSGFDNIMACKIISLYSDNRQYNAPTIIVYVLLFDADTGKLLTIMEGEGITKRRTAATSAVSARFLANPSPKKLAILGSGLQALSHIQVLVDMYPSIEEVTIWNYRKKTAVTLAEQASGWLPGKTIKVFDEVSQAVDDADLIVTATFASTPVLNAAWVKPGAHIMAVGAAVPDMAEMEPELLNKAQVFVDSYGGASKESGDILMSGCTIQAELGEVVAGIKGGRRDDRSVTIYKSLGLAVQDLVAAKIVFDEVAGGEGNPLPVPKYNSDDVTVFLEGLSYSELEPHSVSTELATSKVKMNCTAASNGPKYLSCTIITGTVDESEKSTLCLVYRALTGQLMGIIEGDFLNQLTDGLKASLFELMFPM